ncbi:MAG TPA: UvrD-helicase domain-containing protein [Anaerolineaceae bacterium]|nr:UvrD-helicase domain-containing protein [Anaerolineaceae bacterium]HPN51534.1 UvrD-helicase domain-containing protein [Anaerolineaceae bacterium]
MDDILSGLNQPQIKAVTAPSGPVLVLAGPGSGKTRVLTRRLAYIINNLGVAPFHILSMTFTNKAAKEMQTRVEAMLGNAMSGIWLGTFHSICARILRREAAYLPVGQNFVIYDGNDQETLVKNALESMGISPKQFYPGGILSSISKVKNEMLTPDTMPVLDYRDEIVQRVYGIYQAKLTASNALDFDDLLLCTAQMFAKHQDVRDRYARRFEHILVDEFQDTNQAQYALLRALAGHHNNLFVVGDEDQSIYRWRGADYRNVLRFESDYPQCTKILLEQNYRSSQTVLDAARAVIDNNDHRTPKALFSDRGAGEKIKLYEAEDDQLEAAFVVDTISQALASRRAQGGDFAVMYRTNAQSRLLEEAFLRSNLAYRLVGAQRFYGRREVKDVISYLRLVQNPNDEISLARVINVPPRGVGDKTLLTLQQRANALNQQVGQVLLDLVKGDKSEHWSLFPRRSAVALADFASRLAGWQADKDRMSLADLFDRILEQVGYKEYIDDQSEEGEDRWGNVEELRRLAVECEEMTAFLERVALVSDQDTLPEDASVPTLLTLHAAKGLEFPEVFILGLDQGLLPHSRSKDDPEEMAEERRLFYVGLTRAQRKLYLVRARRRGYHGRYEETVESPFLSEIPENLYSEKRKRSRGYRYEALDDDGSASWGYRERSSSSYRSTYSSGTARATSPAPKPRSAPVVQARYACNQRVRHPMYGEGWVMESRVEDGDETVDVSFDSVGFKRLVASLANLEIIEKKK